MKQIILTLLIAIITITSFSQSFTPPSYADIDNNHRNYVNSVFGTLEPNRVPTGLLLDYAFEFTEPRIYNGTVLHDSRLIYMDELAVLNLKQQKPNLLLRRAFKY